MPEAQPGDQVTEQEGVTAFVAREVSEALDEATLDVSPEDGVEELVLRRRRSRSRNHVPDVGLTRRKQRRRRQLLL